MLKIWSSLAELRQPCLYRPISDQMLDENALVRRPILTSLDRLFCEHLAAGRASFQVPNEPPPLAERHRFINISALQKAIRRGDANSAMRFAQQGCQHNPEQVFRRLATCAVEDVGIGNLLAVGMALAAMGSRVMWASGACDELAAYIAYLLALSPKSRLACDLLSIADYDSDLANTKQRLANAPLDEQCLAATDHLRPLAERIAAAWMVAGTSKLRGTAMPLTTGDRASWLRLLVAGRAPLFLYYVADRTASRLRDAMAVSWQFVAGMLDQHSDVCITQQSIEPGEMIKGFPAAAIDLHTGEGRLALSRFARMCPAIADALLLVPPTKRDIAIRFATFIGEGGQLADRLTFTAAERVENAAHAAELQFAGLRTAEARASLLEAVRSNLDLLNYLRRQSLV